MSEEEKQIKETLKYYEITKTEPTYCEELITTGELKRIIEETERFNKELERLQLSYQESWEDRVRLNNIINELKWKPIEEYDKGNYDWVLVKYFDGDYECVPCVAEKRFGKWHSIDEKEIKFDVKYFMDMQQIDKLHELKGVDKK